MLIVENLGMSTYLVSSSGTNILIDPILPGSYGNGPGSKRYPAVGAISSSDIRKLSNIAAIVISHEHEDHFDIRTLRTFGIKTPIYISTNCSVAIETILKEMRFRTVVRLSVDRQYRIGSLRLRALLPPPQQALLDEWDVLPLVITNKAQDGTFLSMVDRICSVFGHDYPAKYLDGRILTKNVLMNMNRRIYYRSISKLLKTDFSTDFLSWPETVSRFTLSKEKLRRQETAVQLDDEAMLARSRSSFFYSPKRVIPLNSDRPLTKAEWLRLENNLNSFAKDLYASPLFMRLLLARASDETNTFYFILRNAGAEYTYAYCLTSCIFVRVKDKKKVRYASCICFAADLLDVMDGKIEPRVLNLSHSKWECPPALGTRHSLAAQLWQAFHPLRRPDLALRRYRKCLTLEGGR